MHDLTYTKYPVIIFIKVKVEWGLTGAVRREKKGELIFNGYRVIVGKILHSGKIMVMDTQKYEFS